MRWSAYILCIQSMTRPILELLPYFSKIKLFCYWKISHLSSYICLTPMPLQLRFFPPQATFHWLSHQLLPWKIFNISNFKADSIASPLCLCPAQIATKLAVQFNSILSDILDKNILANSRRVATSSGAKQYSQPWYNSDIATVRRLQSWLERCWHLSLKGGEYDPTRWQMQYTT